MKSLILYYSYTGNTRWLAEARAAETGADLCEIVDVKRPGVLAAYTAGCVRALRATATPIQPVKASLEDYESITVMAPVWAGHPAPAVNGVLESLPAGKRVELVLVSGSGKSKAAPRLRALVEQRGCEFAGCADRKG